MSAEVASRYACKTAGLELLSAVVSQSDPSHAPCRAQCERGRDLTAAADAARREDRHRRNRVDDFGYEHHRGDLARVPARFVALRNDDVDAVVHVPLRVHRFACERRDFDAVFVCAVDDVLGRRTERIRNEFDRVRERNVNVSLRHIVGPAQHAVGFLPVGQRREVEPFHQVVDVAPVIGVDHRSDLCEHFLRVGAVHVDRLLRHHGVDAVGHAVHVFVDPVELDLELFGTEADRAEHTKPAGLAHCRDDIAAMGEREDRVLDAKKVTQWGTHVALLDSGVERVLLRRYSGGGRDVTRVDAGLRTARSCRTRRP